MYTFSKLIKNLKKDFSNLTTIKIAVLGDTATQFLIKALRGEGYEQGLNLKLWEADFDQVDRQVFDPSSGLYEFNPEIVLIFHSTHKLLAALSQASYIHIRDGRGAIDHQRFNQAYMMHTTTSPLYPIVASNDIAWPAGTLWLIVTIE